MERTVLVCDWCPHGRNLAVGRVEIRFTGGKPLVFDICKPHQRWLAQRVTPPKARAERQNQGAGDPKLHQALLAILARNRTRSLARPDFNGRLPAHWSTAQKALLKLCDEKRVIRTGKGKYTRYQIAPKRAGGARRKGAQSSRRTRERAEAAPRRRGKRPPSKRAQGSNGAAHEAGLRAPAGSA